MGKQSTLSIQSTYCGQPQDGDAGIGPGASRWTSSRSSPTPETWYRDSWDPDLTVGEWFRLMYESGWGYPTWPEQWGGKGLPDVGRQAGAGRAARRRRARTAVGHRADAARADAVPARQRRAVRSLPARHGLRRRDHVPDAVRARRRVRPGRQPAPSAERDGDEWRITGTKVWTSNAQIVSYGMLLARTNWEVPKHRGLSFFLCPAQQPGVEARPIKQMNGRAEFNLVHFDGAIVADARPARRRGRGLGRDPDVPHLREELLQPGGPRGRPVRSRRPDDAGRPARRRDGAGRGRPGPRQPRRGPHPQPASSGSSTAPRRPARAPGPRRAPHPPGDHGLHEPAHAQLVGPRARGARSRRSPSRTSPAASATSAWPCRARTGCWSTTTPRRPASRTSRCPARPRRSPAAPTRSSATTSAEKVLGLPREPGIETGPAVQRDRPRGVDVAVSPSAPTGRSPASGSSTCRGWSPARTARACSPSSAPTSSSWSRPTATRPVPLAAPAIPSPPGFVQLNLGKRLIAVDLAQPEGRDLVRRLAGAVDVLIENFRPGVMSAVGARLRRRWRPSARRSSTSRSRATGRRASGGSAGPTRPSSTARPATSTPPPSCAPSRSSTTRCRSPTSPPPRTPPSPCWPP